MAATSILFNYNGLFDHAIQMTDPEPKQNEQSPTLAKNVQRQLYSLNYQIDSINKTKKKASKKDVHYIYDNDINSMADSEINDTLLSKGWKSLDLCFRYKILKEFLTSKNIEEGTANTILNALKKQNLVDVAYDKSTRTLSKVTFGSTTIS